MSIVSVGSVVSVVDVDGAPVVVVDVVVDVDTTGTVTEGSRTGNVVELADDSLVQPANTTDTAAARASRTQRLKARRQR